MINEKALARAMRAAYKGAGYEVLALPIGNAMCISGPHWSVVISQDDVPRKVLGLLAEHIGSIPHASAYWCSKEGGAQMQVMDMSMERFNNLIALTKEKQVQAKLTPMDWKGCEIWQQEDMQVAAYNGALTAIGRGELLIDDCMGVAQGCLISKDRSATVLVEPEPALDEVMQKALSRMILVPQETEMEDGGSYDPEI